VAADRVQVSSLADDERDEWTRFVAQSPFGSPYSLPAYQEAAALALGDTTRTFVARRGETIVGGVSVLERDIPMGRFVVPGLLRYYNGFILRDYDTRYPSQRSARQNEVLARLGEALVARRYGSLVLRSRSSLEDVRPLLATGWAARPSYSYVVPLGDLDQLWGQVEQNLRRLVDRARELNLEFVVGGEFDAFYDLHAATGERKDAPVYLPRPAFRTFYETLAGDGLCELYHVRAPDGTIVASQLVLLGHAVTHTVSAAADASRQNTGCNPFLRWSVFEHLAAKGYASNDLTDATLGTVSRFKSQLGGDLVVSLVTSRSPSASYLAQRAVQSGVRHVRSLVARKT
jgi:hypothetical protein